jgi:hypothetical protein
VCGSIDLVAHGKFQSQGHTTEPMTPRIEGSLRQG